MGILLLTLKPCGPHPAADAAFDKTVAALCLVPSLWLAAWLVRARIVADEHGLRWRGVGRERTAAWADVSDFYERRLPSRKAQCVIETSADKVTFGAGAWNDSPALRALVEQNAAYARARTWQTLGLRPELDWPRTFGYDTRANRLAPAQFTGALLLLAGLWAWLFVPKLIRTYGTAEWSWNVAGAALFGLVLLSKGVLVGAARRAARNTRQRFGERITVDKQGVTFTDGARTVAAAWDDITAYRVVRKGFASLCVVETKRGAWDFAPTISESAILCQAIEQHATAAPQTGWRVPDEENLARRWSSGCEGVGERVFHYRTRTNRAMLCLPTVVLIVAALLTGAGLASWGIWGWAFWLLYALPTAWGWARYFGASVRVGECLTQYTAFGPRRLAWSDIDDFYLSGDETRFGNVVGANTRIRFWMGIADCEELKEEIARRAVHSRRRAWETAQTRKIAL